MIMTTKEVLSKIRSVKRLMKAHPDNIPNTEFEDRINDLEEMEDAFVLGAVMKSKNLDND